MNKWMRSKAEFQKATKVTAWREKKKLITINDQVQRILRDKENFILKGVIHSKRLVNQDWISLLI